MTIFEAIGLVWVIFTSSIATVGIIYLAFIGLKLIINRLYGRDPEAPLKVKEMFKMAR